MSPEPYPTPVAVEAAIKDAARKAAKLEPDRSVGDLIQQAYFDRFLTRLFLSDGGWMLKGGASLLARVPAARSTTDLDLFLKGRGLDDALAELRAAAGRDLGDWFRFEYVGHRTTLGGDQQPYAEGYRVSFEVYIGAARRGRLNVDLVVKVATTMPPEVQHPANALDLPRLPTGSIPWWTRSRTRPARRWKATGAGHRRGRRTSWTLSSSPPLTTSTVTSYALPWRPRP